MEGGKRVLGMADGTAPLVSVVTVVYNGAEGLERTIRSVLAQARPDMEYVIVDGGSTDGTVDIIRRFEDHIDYWTSGKDQGIYDAMNKGIGLCRGEWIGLINADDAYPEGAVDRAMAAVEGKPGINIVHGDILMHFPGGGTKVKRARRSGFLLKYWEMVLNHPSFFVRRRYYKDHPIDPSFKVGGDHLWTLQAWREDPGQFLYIPEVLAHFTLGGASMTIPWRQVMEESDKMAEVLGFSRVEKWMARAVRACMRGPVLFKLWYNRKMAHLSGT